MLKASSRVSGYWQMSTKVECDRLLIGLKVRLPHSLSQISERMSSSTGALKPAFVKHRETRVTRSVLPPSSSPTGKRSPSMCLTTPGAVSSEAGYTTQPMIRCAGIVRASTPLGSTDVTAEPDNGPPWPWKYQNGMPFCIVTIMVSGPSNLGNSPATASTWWAFMASTTMSCMPASA